MLGEPEAAEDLTQKIFLLAYRQFRSFRDEDFHCLLLWIASRIYLEELRQERDHVYPQVVTNDDGEEINAVFRVIGFSGSSEGKSDQNDLDKVIREGLSELTPDLRAVLTLVDLQGMSYLQTAEILGIPISEVKSRLAKARVQIRDGLFTPGSRGL